MLRMLYNKSFRPAEGVRKSGIPAFVEMPAPHMMTIFLNFPPSRPKTRSASVYAEVEEADPMFC